MIQEFANWLVYNIIGLDPATRLAGAINFFVYDTIKIIVLLMIISTVMGVVNSYLPIEKLRNFLLNKKLYGTQYFLASLFGALTPFCTCSSIPLFIGFVKGGIPLGVTFAFLITSPLVNEVAVALFLATFGVKATVIYVVSGVMLGTIGGAIMGRMRLEKWLSPWVLEMQKLSQAETEQWQAAHTPFVKRLPQIFADAWGIVRGVLIYIIIGIGIGAAIHGYIPEGFFEQYMGRDNLFAVPVAVICAVPMYANAAGIVPIIQVFVAKGIPLGTAIAFMMGVIGLSLPEAAMLKKVMRWQLIGVFFGMVTLFIILSGYLFNVLL